MKLTYWSVGFLISLGLSLVSAQAQGVGGSQTTSQQTFPGGNPAPSTGATPTEAKEKGIVPGTAKSGAASPGAPTPATAPGTATGTAPAPSPTSGSMSTIVVTGSDEGSIMPTDQPVDSVFGTDLSVQDTPRSVTAISSQLLADANITDLSDFVKVAPSAYTTDQFGIASVPNIRGQSAEVYINGMQRTTRGDGPPTSFNSVENVNLVEGPANSIYGPTANTGGYLDLITKQPFFDKFHSDTEFTYGQYNEKMWTEDFGGPIIKDQLAYRVSYQGDYSGSYYHNIKTQSNDGFVALAWTPNKDFRVDFNSELYDGRFNENTGLNRPTQGLIDGLQYSTGPTNTGSTGGVIQSPGTTRISPSSTLISPDDSDFGKDYNAELKETYNANDNLTFVNHTYYEYFELRNTELAQLYVNLQTSHIVQDRFEAHIDFDTPMGDEAVAAVNDPKEVGDSKSVQALSKANDPLIFKNEIITGVAAKYVNVRGFGDFFNEYLNDTDLSTNTYPTVNNQHNGTNFFTLGNVPGSNFLATTGELQPNSTEEKGYELSAFYQHQIKFTPEWTFIYSGRADLIYDDLSDSVPNNGSGFATAIGVTPILDNGVHDTTTQLLGTGDASITFKPQPWVTTYLTFDYNQSTAGNSAGGFDTYTNGGQSPDYHYANYLYEGGAKFDLMNHSLFTSVDGYYQTHNATTALGQTNEIRTFGAEISTTYQPDKHLSLTFNESYLNAKVINPGNGFTPNVYDAFTTTSSGVNGTGGGSPNFAAASPPRDVREAGLPQFLLSGLATYKLDCGVGASVGYVITDPIPTSSLGNVWIPWQYEIDSSIFYVHKNFSAKINFFNVTDQTNFSTGGYLSSSGNDLITVKEPFHMEGTIGYKF